VNIGLSFLIFCIGIFRPNSLKYVVVVVVVVVVFGVLVVIIFSKY